jgi:hypothetical protein
MQVESEEVQMPLVVLTEIEVALFTMELSEPDTVTVEAHPAQARMPFTLPDTAKAT